MSEIKKATLLAVISVISGVLALTSSVEPSVLLQIEPDTIDLGKVAPNEPHEAHVALMNNGSTRIELVKVATSCSCTSASVDKQNISAGEEATLRVVVQPAGQAGESVSTVQVIYQEPGRSPIYRVQLRIRAIVSPIDG